MTSQNKLLVNGGRVLINYVCFILAFMASRLSTFSVCLTVFLKAISPIDEQMDGRIEE